MKQTLEKIYYDFISQKFTSIHLENFIINYIKIFIYIKYK